MKKQLPFHTMVSVTFLLGMAGCLLLLNLTCGILLRPVFIRDTRQRMEQYGKKLQGMALYGDENWEAREGSLEADYVLGEMYDDYLIRATIINDKGIILNTTDVFSRKHALSIMEKLLEKFEEQPDNPWFFKYREEKDAPLSLCYVIGKEGGYIILTRNTRGIEQNVRIVSVFLILADVLAIFVGVVVWTLATRPFSRSMEQMSSVTQSIAQLDFSQRVNYNGHIQEIVVLSDAIDDLSDRLEKSLNEMKQELERRKQLLRDLAHEIKTPLTTIRGYTENMEIVTAGNGRAARYCQIMLEECTALDVLATEMMEVSTLEGSEGFYEKETIKTLELLEVFRRRIEREFSHRTIVVEGEKAKLWGNPYLLERAVFNYLVNADRYGTEGTEILLTGQKIGEKYRISVTNYGREIPEEERSRIWDAFYKEDKSRRRSGSYGVGLSIVRQIAAMHHAETGVVCEGGKTTFYLELAVENSEYGISLSF